jgi:HAD superfamily hydrolase (TIGR01509 family)
MKLKVKAVLFDMDGTVLDTEPIHTRAIADALERLGIKDEINFLNRCIGINATDMKKLYMNEAGSEEEYDRIIGMAEELAERHKNERGIRVKDGFFMLEKHLSELGIKLYIVTSSARKSALADLERAGILRYFAGLVCFEDYEKGKPEPEPYLKALKLAGIGAEECLAVEDSTAGLTSAVKAGLKCVLIRDMARVSSVAERLAYADLETLADVIDLVE